MTDLRTILKTSLLDIKTCMLSKPQKIAIYKKIKIKAIEKNSGQKNFFGEFFTEKQVFHKNLSKEELLEFIIEKTGFFYKNIIIETDKKIITILVNKKGKQTILQKENTATAIPKKIMQNRKKTYLLEEGIPVPFLIQLGVMTKEGKVVHAKYDKFKQINRFLEFINDCIPTLTKENDIGTKENPLTIVDFGCGKSYLTFALYHFLCKIKGLHAIITGLDLKEDIIIMCSTLAKNFGYDNLHFSTGDIETYRKNALENKTKKKVPDMVITLHACDTATDYALAYAVEQDAKVILSVPCCQHELNKKISTSCPDKAFNSLLKYGLVKERFASLATDVMRAELLEKKGYKVQLLEFIHLSHTPKNILIRAVKQKNAPKDDTSYEAFCKALGQKNTLAHLLEE